MANISVNHMTLIVDGKEEQALQIGTVMTHPDYRKRGLASRLMEEVKKDYAEKVQSIYLFGNDDARSLYQSWGFEAIEEVAYSMTPLTAGKRKGKHRPIDMKQAGDLNLLKQMAHNRQPVSQSFGVTKDQHLLMFYTSKFMGQTLYLLEELDLIVSYEIEDKILHLYDLIGQKTFDLLQVIDHVTTEDIEKIVFYFKPDMDETLLIEERLIIEDQTLLVLPKRDWSEKDFRFPYLSHA